MVSQKLFTKLKNTLLDNEYFSSDEMEDIIEAVKVDETTEKDREYFISWKRCYSMVIEAKGREDALTKARIKIVKNGVKKYYNGARLMDAELN